MKKLILTVLFISSVLLVNAQTYYSFIYYNNTTLIHGNIIVDIDETENKVSVYSKDFQFADDISRTVYFNDRKDRSYNYTYYLDGGGMILVKYKNKKHRVSYVDNLNNTVWFIDGQKSE